MYFVTRDSTSFSSLSANVRRLKHAINYASGKIRCRKYYGNWEIEPSSLGARGLLFPRAIVSVVRINLTFRVRKIYGPLYGDTTGQLYDRLKDEPNARNKPYFPFSHWRSPSFASPCGRSDLTVEDKPAKYVGSTREYHRVHKFPVQVRMQTPWT